MRTIPTGISLPRVALIEDDDTLAVLLRYNIEAAGFAVDWITNGSVAIARVRNDPPDLIVLDWTLPGLSGIEVLRHLRSVATTRNLPILMLTGRTEAADRSHALETGADVFLTKPFSIRELMASVCTLIVRSSATSSAAAIGGAGQWR